jgi:hypothetical protein
MSDYSCTSKQENAKISQPDPISMSLSIPTNPFRMRAYAPGDESVINQHFNRVFNQKRPLLDWHRKFQPEQDGCSILVAVNEDNNIIAQYAVIHSAMQMGDLKFRAGQPVDVYCLRQDGATQRRVYSKLVTAFFDTYGNPKDLPLLYGFPGRRALRLGQLKLGYGDPVPIGFWRRTVERPRLLFRKQPPNEAPDLDAIDRLWRRAAERYPTSVVRDSDWMTRRYLGCTNSPYIHACVSESDSLCAWAVLRMTNKKTANWVDLVWDGVSVGALRELQSKCLASARLMGASRMEMWLSGDAEAEAVFADLGWVREEHPSDLQLVARSFDSRIDAPSLIQQLYLTMGNSDLI